MRSEDFEGEHFEGERCQSCGRGYEIVWAAEDDLWNEVVGTSAGLRCPECFYAECVGRGIFPFFVAFREHKVLFMSSDEEGNTLLEETPDEEGR